MKMISNWLPALRKLQETEISKYISRNSPFSGIWENIIHHEEDDLPEETKELMVEYLHPKLKKLFTEIAGKPVCILSCNGKKLSRQITLQPLEL